MGLWNCHPRKNNKKWLKKFILNCPDKYIIKDKVLKPTNKIKNKNNLKNRDPRHKIELNINLVKKYY